MGCAGSKDSHVGADADESATPLEGEKVGEPSGAVGAVPPPELVAPATGDTPVEMPTGAALPPDAAAAKVAKTKASGKLASKAAKIAKAGAKQKSSALPNQVATTGSAGLVPESPKPSVDTLDLAPELPAPENSDKDAVSLKSNKSLAANSIINKSLGLRNESNQAIPLSNQAFQASNTKLPSQQF